MSVCLTGCELWKRKEGVASLHGKLYPYKSLSDCLALCLELSMCVAVDFSMDVCVVHTDINDTATTFNASSFTQYILNRACRLTTATPAISTVSTVGATATTTQTTYFGNCHSRCTWIVESIVCILEANVTCVPMNLRVNFIQF